MAGHSTSQWWLLFVCRRRNKYKEQVTVKYEQLIEEVGGLEEEWKKYKEAFVGAAAELCGRTSRKGGVSRNSNQGWWTSKVAEAVCEKKEAWKEIEKTKERGNEPDARMIHTYGRKKRAAKRAVDKARRDMEADVYSKLDEDGGKKMIYKMARDRDENSKDVKGGTVVKDRNGKLVTEQEAVLKVWESYFKELLNQERNNNDLELPLYVEGTVEFTDITDTEMHTGMKKGRATGIGRQTQAGANAWRKVEGVMLDRNISKKLKGKGLRTCVTPACLYGLEIVALTEQQQQKLQVCENNWVWGITRTKRVDRRRMNDLRKEVGMQCSLTGRLVRSRMRWADHLVRMDASKLAKRAEVEKHQECRKRGRPQLRWEACVRRDMRRWGEDERWGQGVANRKLWIERTERVARQYFT